MSMRFGSNRVRRPGKGMSPGCLVVFALPFAAVGLGMGGWSLFVIGRSLQASQWPEAPARILESRLETHSDSDGSSYRAVARYEYQYLGKTHTGTRVSFQGGSDNIGSFQQRTAAELERHRVSRTPFPCRVNPSNPAESVLYPQVRIEMVLFQMVFALIFGGAGFGMIYGAVRARRTAQMSAARAAQHPDEPWKWRDDWAAGMIPFEGGHTAAFVTAFAVFWNTISLPLAFSLFVSGSRRPGLDWLVMLFPAVGLVLAAWSVAAIRRWRTYRGTVFQMASVPGVLGGRFGGAVRVPVHLQPADGFRVRLACIQKVVQGDSAADHALWQKETLVTRDLFERDPSRSAIPVVFGVPYDQPPSDPPPEAIVRWELSVEARDQGRVFKATFQVPVFRTSESSPDFPVEAATVSPGQTPPAPAEIFASGRLRVSPISSGGHAYYFPPARQIHQAVFFTIFGAILTAIVVGTWKSHAPRFISILLGFFDALILMGVLFSWAGWKRIEATRTGLTASGGLLGFSRTKVHPADSIAAIETAQTGNVGTRLIFGLNLRDRAGARHTLVTQAGDGLAAETLAAEIRKDLGLRPKA